MSILRTTTGKSMRLAASLLLALSLCLGSIGDLLAAGPAFSQDAFGGEICHSPQDTDGSQGPAGETKTRQHACCTFCPTTHGGDLVLPQLPRLGRLLPPQRSSYGPGHQIIISAWAQTPQQARAPPLS